MSRSFGGASPSYGEGDSRHRVVGRHCVIFCVGGSLLSQIYFCQARSAAERYPRLSHICRGKNRRSTKKSCGPENSTWGVPETPAKTTFRMSRCRFSPLSDGCPSAIRQKAPPISTSNEKADMNKDMSKAARYIRRDQTAAAMDDTLIFKAARRTAEHLDKVMEKLNGLLRGEPAEAALSTLCDDKGKWSTICIRCGAPARKDASPDAAVRPV